MKISASVPEINSGISRHGFRGFFVTALFFLGAFFFFSGCARSEPEADIVIINGAEPGTLDPALVTVQADSRIVRALFEGLTRLDPKTATAIPGLAERWEISPVSF